jgi:hypothetical protein
VVFRPRRLAGNGEGRRCRHKVATVPFLLFFSGDRWRRLRGALHRRTLSPEGERAVVEQPCGGTLGSESPVCCLGSCPHSVQWTADGGDSGR